MILAELTGNTTEAESWKSLCRISLRYLCEEQSAKKLQSTLVWLLVAAIYQSRSAPGGIALHQEKDSRMMCPSARGLFALSIAIHSLKM